MRHNDQVVQVVQAKPYLARAKMTLFDIWKKKAHSKESGGPGGPPGHTVDLSVATIKAKPEPVDYRIDCPSRCKRCNTPTVWGQYDDTGRWILLEADCMRHVCPRLGLMLI